MRKVTIEIPEKHQLTTEQIAQAMYHDPDLHALFDAAIGSKSDDIKLITEMLRRMKEGS